MNITYLIKITRFIGSAFLSILYVKMTTVFIIQYTKLMGNLLTDIERIMSVLVSVILSCVLIYSINHFIIKASPILLGILSFVSAFIFFYILKPSSETIGEAVAFIYSALTHLHSSVAFVFPSLVKG